LVGLGGRIKKDYSKVAYLLQVEAKQSIDKVPFRFTVVQPAMLMKTLQSGATFLTVIINKSSEKRKVSLENTKKLKPSILFSDKKGEATNNTIVISPEETMVIEWK
jgi:beta-galactosidase